MAQQKSDNQQKSASGSNGGGGKGGKHTGWEKIKGGFALLLGFFTIYLLIAFVSFLLQDGADVSHLDVSMRELLTNPNIKIENSGGRKRMSVFSPNISLAKYIKACFKSAKETSLSI